MATETIEFVEAPGQTLTAKVYALGGDTLLHTIATVTERTNALGHYTGTVTSPAVGWHTVNVLSGTTVIASWDVYLTNTARTAQARDANPDVVTDITTIKGYTDDIGVAGAGLTALGDVRLANLDAAVSSRGTSTYAGGDTSGTTTLLSRVPGTVQPQTGDTYALANGASGFVAIKGVVDTVSTNVSTALARLGAWTGTGLNTILGAFRALAAKAAALTPTDLSTTTTFDNTTDSAEAIRDRGDAAWTTGSAGTIPVLRGIVTRSGSTFFVSYHLVVNGAIIAGASLSSLSVTFYDEDGTDLTFSGTPTAHATGIVYTSGTLGTAVTDNRPVKVKVAATYSTVAYSDFLDAVSRA